MLPPLPSWDALHPLVIHFPIVLLMIAPLFIVGGLFFWERSKWFHSAALVLMVLGSASTFVAVSTGEAAGQLADRTDQIESVIERHEQLAETTQIVFAILTGIYLLLVLVPLVSKRPLANRLTIATHGAYALLYAGSLILLVNTAHQGGLLVHEYGVRAMMPQSKAVASASPSSRGAIVEIDHDDD